MGQSFLKGDINATYDRLIQVVLNEDRLASERTNMFLLASSFLVGGLIVALSSQLVPRIVDYILCGVGIMIAILHIFSFIFTAKMRVNFINFILAIENEIPENLRIFAKKKKYEETGWRKIIARKLGLGPGAISGGWLPGLFIAMWFLLLFLGVN